MKLGITTLKSFTKGFFKSVKPGPGKPSQAPQAPEPTSEQQLREALSFIEADEDSCPTKYRHWGLND